MALDLYSLCHSWHHHFHNVHLVLFFHFHENSSRTSSRVEGTLSYTVRSVLSLSIWSTDVQWQTACHLFLPCIFLTAFIFFSWWLLNPLIGNTSQLFALKSVPKCHLTIELHVTHIDFLKSDFVLLVSVILTVCYNICWKYHNFTACVLPWYEGWTSDVIFCWRNFILTLLFTFVTEWQVALSSSKIIWFWLLIILFTSSSHSINIVWVIHAF